MAGLEELQAIILAGGKGERLRPYTDDRPKPMVLILEKPILEYQVRWLASQGIRRIVISCGYLAEVIQEYFGDGGKFGVTIRYAYEEEPLGRVEVPEDVAPLVSFLASEESRYITGQAINVCGGMVMW